MGYAAEVDLLKNKLDQSRKEKQEWLDSMKRYKAEEEKTYNDNVQLQSKLEKFKEYYDKQKKAIAILEIQNSRLHEKNAKMIGHQNKRQKIHQHMKIKQENDALKNEINQWKRKFKKLKQCKLDLNSSKAHNLAQENRMPTSSLMRELNRVKRNPLVSLKNVHSLESLNANCNPNQKEIADYAANVINILMQKLKNQHPDLTHTKSLQSIHQSIHRSIHPSIHPSINPS